MLQDSTWKGDEVKMRWWWLLWQTPPGPGSDRSCDSKSRGQLAIAFICMSLQLRSKNYSTRAILIVISRWYPILSAKHSAQLSLKLGRLPWLCPLLVVTILAIRNLGKL